MTRNERLINNYIYQIRESFSVQQVIEHTGVPKTSCHRVLKNWEKEGKIKRVSVSSHPVLYRYNYQTSTVRLGCEGSRYAEVEDKAKELGVSTRTVYRIEKRGYVKAPVIEKETRPDRNLHLDDVIETVKDKGMFSAFEVVEAMGCRLEQAIGALDTLVSMGKIEKINYEQFSVRYQYVENRRIS